MRILQAVVGIIDNVIQLLTLGFYATSMEVQMSQEIIAEACRNRNTQKGPLVKTVGTIPPSLIDILLTVFVYAIPMYILIPNENPLLNHFMILVGVFTYLSIMIVDTFKHKLTIALASALAICTSTLLSKIFLNG